MENTGQSKKIHYSRSLKKNPGFNDYLLPIIQGRINSLEKEILESDKITDAERNQKISTRKELKNILYTIEKDANMSQVD